VATSEPVVLHHGREVGGASRDEVRPSAFNGLLGGATPKTTRSATTAWVLPKVATART
jgi:hypothetical protein